LRLLQMAVVAASHSCLLLLRSLRLLLLLLLLLCLLERLPSACVLVVMCGGPQVQPVANKDGAQIRVSTWGGRGRGDVGARMGLLTIGSIMLTKVW
jgi:hypothetical protein